MMNIRLKENELSYKEMWREIVEHEVIDDETGIEFSKQDYDRFVDEYGLYAVRDLYREQVVGG